MKRRVAVRIKNICNLFLLSRGGLTHAASVCAAGEEEKVEKDYERDEDLLGKLIFELCVCDRDCVDGSNKDFHNICLPGREVIKVYL